MKHHAGCGKRTDGQSGSATIPAELLNHHERIPLVIPGAMVKLEIPAAGGNFAGRYRPRGVTFLEQPRPRAAGAAKALDEAERAKDGNHPAFLDLDERLQWHLPVKLNIEL